MEPTKPVKKSRSKSSTDVVPEQKAPAPSTEAPVKPAKKSRSKSEAPVVTPTPVPVQPVEPVVKE